MANLEYVVSAGIITRQAALSNLHGSIKEEHDTSDEEKRSCASSLALDNQSAAFATACAVASRRLRHTSRAENRTDFYSPSQLHTILLVFLSPTPQCSVCPRQDTHHAARRVTTGSGMSQGQSLL